MGKREFYEEKGEQLIAPILEELNLSLVDMEYVKEGQDFYLRAYIDKEGGVNIEDCERVSRSFSQRLDQEDFIDGAYILEVSSPGLGRAIKKEKDLARNLGKRIELKTYKAIDKEKSFQGILKSYSASEIVLEEENKEQVFNRKDIALMKEYVEW